MYEQASRLFAERGFAGTSLQDIAQAMGITRPALYYYVKSKDELLAKLVTEITESNTAEIRETARDPGLDPVEKLRKIAHMLAFQRALQPKRFLLLARSEADLPPPLAEAHESAKRETLKVLITIVRNGARAGQFRPVDPRIASLAVMGMCNWVAWWGQASDTTEATRIAGMLAELAVSMIAQSSHRTPELPGPAAALALLRQDIDYLEEVLRLGSENENSR